MLSVDMDPLRKMAKLGEPRTGPQTGAKATVETSYYKRWDVCRFDPAKQEASRGGPPRKQKTANSSLSLARDLPASPATAAVSAPSPTPPFPPAPVPTPTPT